MFALGMVDQPHHAQRPVLHCPKSQFANSLFPTPSQCGGGSSSRQAVRAVEHK
jgi:hypothetical protein